MTTEQPNGNGAACPPPSMSAEDFHELMDVLHLKSPCILLAEDDQSMRELLASVFRAEGMEVVEVADGGTLIRRMREARIDADPFHSPDIILADIWMPDATGLDALMELRRTNALTPFILMTAFPSPETAERARALGASALFEKPFDIGDLRRAVQRFVRLRRSMFET